MYTTHNKHKRLNIHDLSRMWTHDPRYQMPTYLSFRPPIHWNQLTKLFMTLKKGRLKSVYSKQHPHHSQWTDSKDFYYPIFPTNSSISFMHIPLTERETHIFLTTFHNALAMFRLNMYLIVMLIHSS